MFFNIKKLRIKYVNSMKMNKKFHLFWRVNYFDFMCQCYNLYCTLVPSHAIHFLFSLIVEWKETNIREGRKRARVAFFVRFWISIFCLFPFLTFFSSRLWFHTKRYPIESMTDSLHCPNKEVERRMSSMISWESTKKTWLWLPKWNAFTQSEIHIVWRTFTLPSDVEDCWEEEIES